MQLSVGTTPVQLPLRGRSRPMMQNLGPGNIYFDNNIDVSVETGVMMAVGSVYEFPDDLQRGGGLIWFVADQDDCDLRFMSVG